QQGVGSRLTETILPSVQFRAASGSDRRRIDAVARPPTFVSAGGCVSLPPSVIRGGRARPGDARRAGVPDTLALEHDDLARGSALSRRPKSAAATPADARGRSIGVGVPRRGRVSRKRPV